MALKDKRSERPAIPNGGKCVKCGSRNLYHDYDPRGAHNGYTCAMCGTEQPLNSEGRTSTIGRYKGGV